MSLVGRTVKHCLYVVAYMVALRQGLVPGGPETVHIVVLVISLAGIYRHIAGILESYTEETEDV